MSNKNPNVQAALEAAKIRAEMAKQRYPMLQEEQQAQTPPSPNAPQNASQPAPQAPRPNPSQSSSSLQTASYDALMREIERRKEEARKALADMDAQTDFLKAELTLRQMEADKRDKLRAVPEDIIREMLLARGIRPEEL